MPFTDMVLLAVTIALALYVVPRTLDGIRAGLNRQRSRPRRAPRVQQPMTRREKIESSAVYSFFALLLIVPLILFAFGILEPYSPRGR